MKKIRDIAHIVIGFTVLYYIINATDFIEYEVWMKILGVLFIGCVVGSLIGAIWEYGNKLLFNIQPDIQDVYRTAVGGCLGVLLAVNNKDLLPGVWYYVCLALVVADLTRAIIKKYKK